MADMPALPPFAAIVVAAGQGLRAGGDTPKQFRPWRGKPLIRHSIDTLRQAGASPLIVVIPSDGALPEGLREANPDVIWVAGGASRQDSVRNGLEAAVNMSPVRILIHDAARPHLPFDVIRRLLSALEHHAGAIPVLPVVDSLAVAGSGDVMQGKADRESLRRVQTPQGFRFSEILTAHRAWSGPTTAGDDAQVLSSSGGSVALVEGDDRLRKFTFAEDFAGKMGESGFRIGQGFDVHRLQAGEELWLCGTEIDHDKGLAGHSDADVALHAITDAVLGALGDGDIGTHFPPSDPQWQGARSAQFLEHAVKLAREAGFAISNLDLTLICEEPKIGPHRDAMRQSISEIMGVAIEQVSVKATTTERLGFTGRGEGIAAQAIVALQTHKG